MTSFIEMQRSGMEYWLASDPIIKLAVSKVAAISSPQQDCSCFRWLSMRTRTVRAVFLDDMRVQTRETKTVLTLENVHRPFRYAGSCTCIGRRPSGFASIGASAASFGGLILQPPEQETVCLIWNV